MCALDVVGSPPVAPLGKVIVAAPAHKVLLVEDPGPMRAALADAVRSEGFQVEAVGELQDALRLFAVWRPHLVILDLAVKSGSSLSVCHDLIEATGVPVILIAS